MKLKQTCRGEVDQKVGKIMRCQDKKTQTQESKKPAKKRKASCLWGGHEKKIEKEEQQSVTRMTAQGIGVASSTKQCEFRD